MVIMVDISGFKPFYLQKLSFDTSRTCLYNTTADTEGGKLA